jgi:glycosyltransferase involved in cell wall biosynthesis
VSRLLVLLPSVPAPLDTGAKIRNSGLLKVLATEHVVDAIAFGSAAAEADLAKLVRRAIVVPMPRPRTARRRALDLARSDLPDIAYRVWSAAYMQAVRRCLGEGAYHAVQAEGLEVASYLSAVPPSHCIYDAHNAEFLLQRRLHEAASSPLAKAYSRLQWRRLERFERLVVRRSRLTLAVSEHDANQLLALAGTQASVQVVPNGIDAAAYPFSAPTSRANPWINVLFLGKMDFRPNADGLRWFIDHVLRPLDGEARLFAVGAAPPRWLVDAGQHDDRIAVTGYVADERPYLRRCAALVLPVRAGAGSRLKALVAMASGLPIVSTRLGVEGLDAEPDTHYLACESAVDWVVNLKRLLGDPTLGQRLAQNGRALVERRYDWSAIRAEVRNAYAWLSC